jgi:hypothetical protein
MACKLPECMGWDWRLSITGKLRGQDMLGCGGEELQALPSATQFREVC